MGQISFCVAFVSLSFLLFCSPFVFFIYRGSMKAEHSACFIFFGHVLLQAVSSERKNIFFKFILSKIKTSNINVFL